jgi:hypothetical protein
MSWRIVQPGQVGIGVSGSAEITVSVNKHFCSINAAG